MNKGSNQFSPPTGFGMPFSSSPPNGPSEDRPPGRKEQVPDLTPHARLTLYGIMAYFAPWLAGFLTAVVSASNTNIVVPIAIVIGCSSSAVFMILELRIRNLLVDEKVRQIAHGRIRQSMIGRKGG